MQITSHKRLWLGCEYRKGFNIETHDQLAHYRGAHTGRKTSWWVCWNKP